jgi:tRNA1(Val) A37 N6-methylase TrmN6
MVQFTGAMDEMNMSVVKCWNIKQRPGAPVSRLVAEFRREKATPRTEDIIVRNPEGGYHDQFIKYLRPYYLNL